MILGGEHFSKSQLDAKLDLSRIENTARRTEAGDRRRVQIAATVERRDVSYIQPVEEIEEIEAEFRVQSIRQFDRSRDTQIDRGKPWSHQCVSSERSRAIREWVAVIVGVEASKDREGSPAFNHHQRTELEFPQQGRPLRRLFEQRKREPMRQMLT